MIITLFENFSVFNALLLPTRRLYFTCICLFVNRITQKLIMINFYGMVGYNPGTSRLHFGGNPDPGIFGRNLTIVVLAIAKAPGRQFSNSPKICRLATSGEQIKGCLGGGFCCLNAFSFNITFTLLKCSHLISFAITVSHRNSANGYGCFCTRMPLDEKLLERDLQAALQLSKQSTEDGDGAKLGLHCSFCC